MLSTSHISFRRLLAKDITDCLEIFDANVPSAFSSTERAGFLNYLNGASNYYMMLSRGQLVGCGGFDTYPERYRGYLTWGMIHPDYQGCGLGKALTQHRIKCLRKLRIRDILIDTTPRSSGFYEKLGFLEHAVEEDGFASGYDRIEMVLAL